MVLINSIWLVTMNWKIKIHSDALSSFKYLIYQLRLESRKYRLLAYISINPDDYLCTYRFKEIKKLKNGLVIMEFKSYIIVYH